MKTIKTLAVVAGMLLVCPKLWAALYNFDVSSSTISPNPYPTTLQDGNPNGATFTETVSGSAVTAISDITVGLNISGDFNGDVYAYLTHNGSPVSILLNRVGRVSGNLDGSSDTGFNVFLNDSASPNIHDASAGGGVLAGTFAPDGRNFNPATVLGSVNPTTTLLGTFGGMNANGTWSLFLADMVSGGDITLNSWSLDVELSGVPEPTNVALAVFALLLVGAKGASWWMDKRSLAKARY